MKIIRFLNWLNIGYINSTPDFIGDKFRLQLLDILKDY